MSPFCFRIVPAYIKIYLLCFQIRLYTHHFGFTFGHTKFSLYKIQFTQTLVYTKFKYTLLDLVYTKVKIQIRLLQRLAHASIFSASHGMDAALLALGATDTDASDVANALDASDSNCEVDAPDVSDSIVEPALLALRGHRFKQRGPKLLDKARAAKTAKGRKNHCHYVAAVANRKTSRPTEVIKLDGPRFRPAKGKDRRRWHAIGILSVCFNPLSKDEDAVVRATVKRAVRRRKLKVLNKPKSEPRRGVSRVNEVTTTMARKRHASPAHIGHAHCSMAKTIIDRPRIPNPQWPCLFPSLSMFDF